jgi:hypothetical protein
MRSFFRFGLVLSVLFVGCNTPTPANDAAVVVDAATANDAAAAVDAFANDAAVCSSSTCTGAHACVRGTCIATCGADVSGWDAALATGLVVDGVVCRTPAAIEFANGHVYELMASTTGMVTTFQLGRWTPGTDSPTVSMVASAQYTATAATTMAFAGGYIAVNADETRALFGYTTTLSGSVGGVFDVVTGTGAATEVRADGNFDATFLGANSYLVNATIGGMQGVYRGAPLAPGTTFTQVVSHLGDASGNVAMWSTGNVVLAGGSSFGSAWMDGSTMGDRVLVLDPAMLASATTAIDGNTVQQLMLPSAFELLSGDRIASVHYDASFTVDAVDVRTLSHSASGVSMSASTHLTTGATFTGVTAAGSQVVLSFAHGLLFVH